MPDCVVTTIEYSPASSVSGFAVLTSCLKVPLSLIVKSVSFLRTKADCKPEGPIASAKNTSPAGKPDPYIITFGWYCAGSTITGWRFDVSPFSSTTVATIETGNVSPTSPLAPSAPVAPSEPATH